jgi:esterase/lipase superfamily enzyme
MRVEYHKWYSQALGRDMELKIYGHYGKAILSFPCSRGRFFDFEVRGMIKAVESFIEGGKIKLVTVDAVDSETWYNSSILPGDRNARYGDYDRYIIHEVIPLIHQINQNKDRIFAMGCSLGAYHAVNFFLKHPDVFDGVLAMSGLYSLERKDFSLEPQDMQYVYYNSPLSYLSSTRDPWFLDLYRKSSIVVVCGQGRWEEDCIADTHRLKEKFEQLQIPAIFDFWGYDVDHDWPSWLRQLPHMLNRIGF